MAQKTIQKKSQMKSQSRIQTKRQTRSQTRAGAPPPPTLWPDAIAHRSESHPEVAPSSITVIHSQSPEEASSSSVSVNRLSSPEKASSTPRPVNRSTSPQEASSPRMASLSPGSVRFPFSPLQLSMWSIPGYHSTLRKKTSSSSDSPNFSSTPSGWTRSPIGSDYQPQSPPESLGTPIPRLTLTNILTTVAGTQPNIPVLASLYQFLNGVDVETLCAAAPRLRRALQHPRNPLPSFRCQDLPPLAAIKEIDPAAPLQLLVKPIQGPRQRCNVPGHHMVPQRRCEGFNMGYTNHGANFWVCVHCSRRAWERYSLARDPICYDLCCPCSRLYRYMHPVAAVNQCLCQWPERDGRLHLCSDCRMQRNATQHIMDWHNLVASQMRPQHTPAWAHPLRVADYIQANAALGESTCRCGSSVANKLNSYLPAATAAVPNPQHDFTDLVRICSHCRREKFLVPDVPF